MTFNPGTFTYKQNSISRATAVDVHPYIVILYRSKKNSIGATNQRIVSLPENKSNRCHDRRKKTYVKKPREQDTEKPFAELNL